MVPNPNLRNPWNLRIILQRPFDFAHGDAPRRLWNLWESSTDYTDYGRFHGLILNLHLHLCLCSASVPICESVDSLSSLTSTSTFTFPPNL